MDMDTEYYDITANLDARAVLRYLNDLGIHNISGEVLKYFITDLKKFIKYELQKSSSKESCRPHVEGPERLHGASTFCSRSRSKIPEGEVKCTTCHRECTQNRRVFRPRSVQSAPNLGQKEEEKPLRRACSCVKVEKKPETNSIPRASSSNIIKVPKQEVKKKCDPVSLYHYYTSMWAKYKSNVPGENDWAELRWSMRQKMAGYSDKENKVTETHPRKTKSVKKQPSSSNESKK